MKSREISAQTREGTGKGCSNPAGCNVSILFRWHMEQERTKSPIMLDVELGTEPP